tara:strand:- start:190 stop:1077 length:888 start_codon:yes stop_codon:yes gene_type:complete
MPFQKTFRILLEEDNTDGSILDSKGGASFLSLNGTDTSGAMNADSAVLGVDGTAAEGKPGWLSENADGSGDYAKRRVIATNSGWVFTPGQPNSGSDNTGAQPEVIECHRRLKDTIDVPTGNQVSIGTGTAKTTFYPDGDTFTGEASSDVGDVVAYVYFNEPINVTGTPQLQLNQATALGSNFGTIMDYNTSYSDEGNGIMAFALPAGEDTRTSNVTNNTLGLITSSTISLNSGRIDKMTGDRIVLEDVIASYSDNDTEAGIMLENEVGHLLEEAGVGMPADLDLGIDENAAFTVS